MERAFKVCLAVLILARAGHAGPPQTTTPGGEPCDGVLVPVASSNSGVCIKPGSGESFKDCPECPEMVVVPAGSFMMGSPADEPERSSDEGPQHEVRIARQFAVSKFEVTFEEWDGCSAGGGCDGYRPNDEGWGRENRPVINVSWNDAKSYVNWLSKKTGARYRLLSEAEWEYAARAGVVTSYSWGADPGTGRANCDGCGNLWGLGQTAPVGSFKPNSFGLHDMHGNVWEWVEDAWHDSYEDAPADGSPWLQGVSPSYRVVRGGSWRNETGLIRAAVRAKRAASVRFDTLGFRVARRSTLKSLPLGKAEGRHGCPATEAGLAVLGADRASSFPRSSSGATSRPRFSCGFSP